MNIFKERSNALTGLACLKKAIGGLCRKKANARAGLASGGMQ